MGIAKSIDPGQPAQSAQSDQSKLFAIVRFSLSDNSIELNCHIEIIEPYSLCLV